MNGRLYPAEVQKFFYSDEYDSFWEAAKVPGKVAMISHLLETSEEDNPGFDGLVHNLHNINGTNKPYSLDWYAQVLFQEEGKKCSNCDYFFYEGSLSFPPCSEVALWFVMMKTIGISERQLNVLISVLSSTTQEPMVCNSRLPQPANFRDILQHRELDFKSYDNYRPSPPPIMPPPGAYPPGVRPPPPGAYPPMMPPAYRQDPSAGGQNAYPPQPYPSYPTPPYPNPYPFPTPSTPSPYYPDVTTESTPSYPPNPYHDQYNPESPPSYPPNPYHDQYTPETPPSYPPNPYYDQDVTTESPPSYPYQDQYPPHIRYPYPPPSHYPVPTTAAPYNPTTTEEPDYPHYNQPTPPERYYRHPTAPPYQPTTTKEATTTTTITTTTEKPYQYPTTETPHPDYNPGTSTHEHGQYPTHEHNQYPRFNGQHILDINRDKG